MPSNSSLNLTALDFDNYKQNLITYMKGQSRFTGYNFDGDDFNVFFDILAYNSFLNGFYLNMAASEAFLDSAQLRDSVISRAKELNYVPSSMSSAVANVNMTFNTVGISNLFEIAKGTQFSGRNSNGSFIFTTPQDIILQSGTSTFSANNIQIFEGTYINETFIVDNTIETQQFILSNPNIDASSLQVTVSENNGANIAPFVQANTLFGLSSSSNVYFIQASSNTKYQILFGDGIFGRYPLNSAVVLATYRITSGSDGNGISTFQLDTNLGAINGGYATPIITTLVDANNNPISSINGANAESIESIRFRAPRSYQTQLSAITNSDYEEMILKAFPDIKSCHAYGGETVTTAIRYNSVFIVPSTFSGYNLTNFRKQQIVDFLTDKNTIGMNILITDPDYLYLTLSTNTVIDFSSTNKSSSTFQSLIAAAINTYNINNLEDFNIVFRNSLFESYINNLDSAIVSSEAVAILEKRRTIPLNTVSNISLSFNNTIQPGTITSSSFIASDGLTYLFTDYNPNNDTFVKKFTNNILTLTNTTNILYKVVSNANTASQYISAGTIDYSTGSISTTNLIVANYLNSPGIVFMAEPVNIDVIAINNDILKIDLEQLSVNITPL